VVDGYARNQMFITCLRRPWKRDTRGHGSCTDYSEETDGRKWSHVMKHGFISRIAVEKEQSDTLNMAKKEEILKF